MRGTEREQVTMFSYVSLEERIPTDHPLRPVRAMVNRALVALSPRFDALYVDWGRPSIPPEQLLRVLLLQVLYTVRSERQLMEQLDYNLLFRWFVSLGVDDAARGPSRNGPALERDRPPHHPPSRLRRHPTKAETHQGDLWLAQDRRVDAADATSRPRPRGLDVYLCDGRLQPGAHSESHRGPRGRVNPRPEGWLVVDRGGHATTDSFRANQLARNALGHGVYAANFKHGTLGASNRYLVIGHWSLVLCK